MRQQHPLGSDVLQVRRHIFREQRDVVYDLLRDHILLVHVTLAFDEGNRVLGLPAAERDDGAYFLALAGRDDGEVGGLRDGLLAEDGLDHGDALART